jgi:hypothetical protein
MSDLMSKAVDWLAKERGEHLARTVIYHRGSDSFTLKATPGKTPFRIVDGYGNSLVVVSRDFLILADDLKIGGQVVTPIRGDLIVDGDFTYEVNSPGDEPEWRWSDSQGKSLRIYTKEVS